MELDWITPLQAANLWRITERQVQSLCAQGKVNGSIKVSRVWLIPKDAKKPLFKPFRDGFDVLTVGNDTVRDTIFDYAEFSA